MAGLARDLKMGVLTPTGTGDQVGIAAVAGKKIHITSLVLVASAATTVTLKTGTTAVSGPMALPANGVLSITSPDSAAAVVLCEKNEAFTINQSADGVDGWAVYYLT